MDLETVRRWMEDSLQGLCHLHSAGVLHHNLKPTSVLVFSTGNASQPYRVKLSNPHPPSSSSPSPSSSSPPFTTAPEALSGRYDPSSDVFVSALIIT